MRRSRGSPPPEGPLGTAAQRLLSALLALALFPAYGLQPTLVRNLRIRLVFTLASVARGHAVRRVFEGVARCPADRAAPGWTKVRR